MDSKNLDRIANEVAHGKLLASGSVEETWFFFFSSRRRHMRLQGDWSSDVCSSDLISFEPCAGRADSPWMEDVTFSAGYFPPLLLLSRVRSVGGTFSALAAGPPPLPSVPWQTAQYAVYISLPDTGDVDLIGTCFMDFSGWSCAATVQAHTIRVVNIRISFFMDIAF